MSVPLLVLWVAVLIDPGWNWFMEIPGEVLLPLGVAATFGAANYFATEWGSQ